MSSRIQTFFLVIGFSCIILNVSILILAGTAILGQLDSASSSNRGSGSLVTWGANWNIYNVMIYSLLLIEIISLTIYLIFYIAQNRQI